MNIQGWPFLISRNKTYEYRAVVAPQFLCDVDLSDILIEASGGTSVTDRGWVVYRQMRGLRRGDVTLIFRVVLATERHLGLRSKELLYDQHYRPIYLTEGLVLEGVGLDVRITDDNFNFIHHRMQDTFRLFWESIANTPKTYSSQSLNLKVEDDESKCLKVKTMPPFDIPTQIQEARDNVLVGNPTSSPLPDHGTEENKQLAILIGGALAAAAALLLGYILSRGR